jgi:hypothetical protein
MTPMNHANIGAINGADSTLNLMRLEKESDWPKRWKVRHLTFIKAHLIT